MTTPTTPNGNNSSTSSSAASSTTLGPNTFTSTSTSISTTTADSPPPYPRDYFFPPFFTRQPVPTTHHAQRAKWAAWILAYGRHRRVWKLALADAVESELFWNRRIGRRLAAADAREVLDWMRVQGWAEWVGDGRNVCWLWWRTVEEWAAAIAEWVEETGQKNTVLTLYELTESEATVSQEFHGMDPEVLQRALNVLVKRGKAQVFGHEDQQGVKFF